MLLAGTFCFQPTSEAFQVDVTHSSGALAGGDKGVDVVSVNNITLGVFWLGTPTDSAKSLITERGNVLLPFFKISIIVLFSLFWDLAYILDFNIINVNQATWPSNIAM